MLIMSEQEFKAITTQEEFDNAVKNRLKREKEKYEAEIEKYSDYEELKQQNNALQQQLDEYSQSKQNFENQINDLQSEVKNYKSKQLKTDIALEYNIPKNLADRLQGEDEESLRKDAESISAIFAQNEPLSPLKSSEPQEIDNTEVAYKNLANDLFKGEE